MLNTALALARRGLHVFPIAPRDKVPALRGNGCLDATVDEITIHQWWSGMPTANVGVRCGRPSNLLVVDIDDAEAEMARLEAAHAPLPASVEVLTSRGRHVWLRPGDCAVRNSAGKLGPGIDIRGDGGYVLAPPSIHPSGKLYAWSVDSAKAIAPAPQWLLDQIAAPSEGAPPPIASSEWHDLVAEIREGRRDDTITRVCGHLLRRYVDPRLALELMHALNGTRCSPPLPDEDVARIVNSIAGREIKRRTNGRG